MARLGSAVLARCPVCGSGGIWKSFGQTVDACPSCGYRYSREPGYWTGALIVNIGVAILLFFVIFVGGMLLTWPGVPWTLLLVATMATMILAPIVLYPMSKTVWVWLDLKIHPYAGEERDWERQRS